MCTHFVLSLLEKLIDMACRKGCRYFTKKTAWEKRESTGPDQMYLREDVFCTNIEMQPNRLCHKRQL